MERLFLGGFLFVLAFAASASAAVYEVDPMHSTVGFSVQHLMISNVKGVFNDYTARFATDDKNNLVSVEADIKADSINTRIDKRDTHLRSADFFDAANFPKITFASTSVSKNTKGEVFIRGKLTIKGNTSDILMVGAMTGPVKDPWGGTRMGFRAEGKVSRKDFGLTWNQMLETGGAVVGDEVTIMLDGEGVLKK